MTPSPVTWLIVSCFCVAAGRAAIVPVGELSPTVVLASEDNQSGNDTSGSNETESNGSSTLKLVHVLFRHGPRTPVSTYPNDPYINETYQPYGWGALTNNAKVELYKIGKQLRKRYKDFMAPYYVPDLLHAQSTTSPRTMMSLQMVLAGLFPPRNTPMEWNLMLDWQPIPVFAEPEETDIRLRMKVPCPRYDEAVLEVLNLPEVKMLHKQNADLLEKLTELTGLNVTYTHDVTNVFISLLAQENYGLKLPDWTKDYYPDKMLPLAAQSYLYDAYTPELRKLKGGFYLDHMYEQMQARANGNLEPSDRRMFLYCAHDWTVTNILSALGVWQPQMPRFSALIAFELHKNDDTGEYFVEIYFQNDPEGEPEQLQVPGCAKQCPLEKLLELSEHVLPDGSYEQLCRAKGTSNGERVAYHK
ncbi:venom acid phosphatase Acph-1 [Scaptodrosophila lebanonensis]|uniref:Venom acid phosphatase Acph-1 n=1 Tax=Drosophila lebanonensis TaxID=7225 RepID=A0A6J2UIJ3_DROLE|nr:venom acid phosphatase Acph-1 [Scaptodrosophila lebanonensis]